MKTRLALASVALAVPALLAGCGVASEEPSVTEDVSVGSNSDDAAEDADVAEDESADEEAVFGETVKWPNGVEVTVGKPKKVTFTEYSSLEQSYPENFALDVTVVNNSSAKFDIGMMLFSLQAGNEVAEEVYDEKFDGLPYTTLLKGREAKFKLAYGAKNIDDLVLEVEQGDYESAPAYFTSK